MILDIHTHSDSALPGVYAIYNGIVNKEWEFDAYERLSLGVHPWYIDALAYEEQLHNLREWARKDQVKLIGEAGIDKLRGPDLKLQEKVFIEQIRIAEYYHKPLIIHCVRAFNEIMAIQKIIHPRIPLIIHGYTNKASIGRELINKGFYLSFGEAILHKPYLQEFIKEVPFNKIFIETDDSKQNIEEIYKTICKILNISRSSLEDILFQNYLEITI